MPYRITSHAAARIVERDLTAEELNAALENKRAFLRSSDGRVLYRDPRSRCAVVIDPVEMTLVTAMRLTRKQMKRRFSR